LNEKVASAGAAFFSGDLLAGPAIKIGGFVG
jgi:hypothetical protein